MIPDHVHIPTPSTPSAGPVHFPLSPEDTRVSFTTRHLFGLGTVTGTVKLIGGRVTLDGDHFVGLEADLDMTSFSSARRKRDEVVASPRFLDSGAHPVAHYRATVSEPTSDGLVVRGALTVKGKTSPVDLRVDMLDFAPGATAHAKATVDRFAFGITVPTALASRNLQVSVSTRLVPVSDRPHTVHETSTDK
jgi:polyisoprenoid-binding protein YceI